MAIGIGGALDVVCGIERHCSTRSFQRAGAPRRRDARVAQCRHQFADHCSRILRSAPQDVLNRIENLFQPVRQRSLPIYPHRQKPGPPVLLLGGFIGDLQFVAEHLAGDRGRGK
jgi:hypothetical protein